MSRIEELRKLNPEQRLEKIRKIFRKNKAYFDNACPEIGRIINPGGIAPYKITITDDFLEITHKTTGELCHPEVGLDKFAESLGGWTHNAWNDLIEGQIYVHPDYGVYSQFTRKLQESLLGRFPWLLERMKNRIINLPKLPNGKRFSNSTLFIGIFHGLHIDHYLSNTQLNNAAFIEPEFSRFVLSCYFLDYQEFDKRFGGLILNVGEDFPHNHINRFFSNARNTAPVWVRVLPGYASDKVEPLTRQFRLKWRHSYDIWVPAEFHLQALRQAMKNITLGKKIYVRQGELSPESRIAVVGTGPSLDQDLEWLKKNQDQMIIFSAYSAVSALQKHGIKPDFQISLEFRSWEPELYERLQLDPSIPMVTNVGDVPNKFDSFDKVFMLPGAGEVYPVKFNATVPFMSPTTGNTAFAFACRCKPKQIYIFGLDFGFRDTAQTHTSDSSVYQEEDMQKTGIGSSNVEVPANFSAKDVVYTQSYFNQARLQVEQAIAYIGKGIDIFNCSDGARINGAQPCSSDSIPVTNYDKSPDVENIYSMFSILEEGKHWESYKLDGEQQLEEYKKAMLKELKMTKFNWRKFTLKIDQFKAEAEKQLPRAILKNRDNRINPYIDVMNDLLSTWYRMLCFTNNEQEWQSVYNEGYKQICEFVEEMSWDVDDQALNPATEKNV